MTQIATSRTIRIQRLALSLSAAALAANALYMLADPAGWYGTIEGVPDTGPYNPHFVRDIGVAYLTCALAAAASARWLHHAFALMGVVTVFLGLHTGLHIWDMAAGRLPLDHLLIDAPGVLGPALVTGWLAWWTRRHAG